MATRIVEWDDFTGGYYVGPAATKQPRNTFQGDNVAIAMDDSTLIPMYQPTQLFLSGTDVVDDLINNTALSVIGKPACLDSLMAFVAKTSSAVYLYVVNISTSVVTRATLSLSGAVADFAVSLPVMINQLNSSNMFIFIAGDANRVIRMTVSSSGTISTQTNVDISGLMSATGQTRLTGIAIWGARMVGWNASPYLYFSNAAAFGSTWTATNYIIIGYAEDPISVCVPRNYDLIIGKPSGWYSVTGVLSYSAAVRQINNGLGVIESDPVAEWNNSVVFNADTGSIDYPVNLYTVTGARVTPMVFQRFSVLDQELNISKGPLGILQVGLTDYYPDPVIGINPSQLYGKLWLLNQQNRWSKVVIPNVTGISLVTSETLTFYPAAAFVSRSVSKTFQRPIVIMQVGKDNANDYVIAVQIVKLPTFEPGKNSDGSPATATALLADYASQVPITVKDVYVEVEAVQLLGSSAYTADGNIMVKTNMKYPVGDLSLATGEVSSSIMLQPVENSQIPGVGTRFLGRVYRFRPDNPGYGYGIEVQVQFSGCKLRRVMAVVEETK